MITIKKLKSFRKKNKLTTGEFGEFANISGRAVRYWESGKVKINQEKAKNGMDLFFALKKGDSPEITRLFYKNLSQKRGFIG